MYRLVGLLSHQLLRNSICFERGINETGDFAIRSPRRRGCRVSVLAAISFGLRRHAKGRPHYRGWGLRLADARTLLILAVRFGAGRVLRGPPFALGIGLHVADRLRLRVNRLGLRIADRLGQHLMQLSLGRCGRLRHLATNFLSTSRLP